MTGGGGTRLSILVRSLGMPSRAHRCSSAARHGGCRRRGHVGSPCPGVGPRAVSTRSPRPPSRRAYQRSVARSCAARSGSAPGAPWRWPSSSPASRRRPTVSVTPRRSAWRDPPPDSTPRQGVQRARPCRPSSPYRTSSCRWTPQKRPLIDTSKPAISGMATETGGVLPRGLRGAQVGLDLRAPAAWPALEDMAMMQQAIQQGGDGRGVAESFAPVVNGPV